MKKKINFDANKEEIMLISKIANRATKLFELKGLKMDLEMDLAATHLNGCPLNLKELLEADEFNFSHDIFGIRIHLDRKTGKLDDFFLPRFSA